MTNEDDPYGDSGLQFMLFDYQVYREEQISSNVNQVIQTSGFWSNDVMQTVRNTNHSDQETAVTYNAGLGDYHD